MCTALSEFSRRIQEELRAPVGGAAAARVVIFDIV
jgi:hypothetical protein